MPILYSFLMYLLTPYMLLRLWWKSRKLPAYRQRISERFCFNNLLDNKADVWLHAVSLGEVIAAIPLINALLEKGYTVLVTTLTPTGSERVTKHFGNKVKHQYLPYDLPLVLKRFFKTIKPKIGIIMETELWPNLIYQAHAAKVPLLLANARLSDDSKKSYQAIRFIIKPVLNLFSAILPQSAQDAQRFIELGAQEELVKVLGNIKYDLQVNSIDHVKFNHLKNQWGANRPTVIIASTHDNEESQILAQIKKLQQAIPQVIMLIAPRHPERFKTVYDMCVQQGLKTGLRSDVNTLNEENEVVVLDSLGELLGMYSICDYAFVGGSLVPVGGHNVLEPIAVAKPVISGNKIHNFKVICENLLAANGMIMVENASQIIDKLIYLYNDKTHCEKMVANATEVFKLNKGAVDRHLQQVEKLVA